MMTPSQLAYAMAALTVGGVVWATAVGWQGHVDEDQLRDNKVQALTDRVQILEGKFIYEHGNFTLPKPGGP